MERLFPRPPIPVPSWFAWVFAPGAGPCVVFNLAVHTISREAAIERLDLSLVSDERKYC